MKNVSDKISYKEALLRFLIRVAVHLLQNIEDDNVSWRQLNAGILRQASTSNKSNGTHTIFTWAVHYDTSNNILKIGQEERLS